MSSAVQVRRGPVPVLVFLLVVLVPAFAAQDDSGGDEYWEKKSYQWFDDLAESGVVRVVNPYGNVYARFGGYESKLEVLATVQRLEPELPELVVERSAVEGGFEVTTRDPGQQRRADGSWPPPRKRRDRVDLVVFVPRGHGLDVRTVGDLIEAKGLESDLTARTENGDIRIRSIKGRVQASSDRGHLSVALESGFTEEPQQLSTTTGDIEVHLWEDAAYDVAIATSGEISTDFSLTIEHRRFEEPGKHARAEVGEGGAGLKLTSKRGRVRLLRMQKFFTPDE